MLSDEGLLKKLVVAGCQLAGGQLWVGVDDCQLAGGHFWVVVDGCQLAGGHVCLGLRVLVSSLLAFFGYWPLGGLICVCWASRPLIGKS